jgi:hypothetical protein
LSWCEAEPQARRSQQSAGDDRNHSDDLDYAVELDGQRARWPAGLAGQGSNAGNGRIGANRLDDTLALTLYDECAGDHRLSCRMVDCHTLATDHGLIDRQRVGDGERQVSADAISGSKHNKIATHQLACVDNPQLAVPAHPGVDREQRTQSLRRTVSAILLSESEDGIENDHHDNRCSERGLTGKERQTGGHPQQDRQQVGELLAEVP